VNPQGGSSRTQSPKGTMERPSVVFPQMPSTTDRSWDAPGPASTRQRSADPPGLASTETSVPSAPSTQPVFVPVSSLASRSGESYRLAHTGVAQGSPEVLSPECRFEPASPALSGPVLPPAVATRSAARNVDSTAQPRGRVRPWRFRGQCSAPIVMARRAISSQ